MPNLFWHPEFRLRVTSKQTFARCSWYNLFVKLSRHARNNIRLYEIKEDEIVKTVDLPDFTDRSGNKTVATKRFLNRFSGYPLKVVYEKRGSDIFLITAYPLKRQQWRRK